MEIVFQQKAKAIRKTAGSKKLIGVRQRGSGRWVAEIKDTSQKIRMWLGTFESAEEAARAYDEAACLLRGSNTRTNFVTQVSPNSPLASRIKNLVNKTTRTKQQQQQQQQQQSPSSSSTHHQDSSSSSSSCAADDTTNPPSYFSFDDDVYKPDVSNCSEIEEFLETQISASLYAINGVHQYMDTFWDLPLLSPLLS